MLLTRCCTAPITRCEIGWKCSVCEKWSKEKSRLVNYSIEPANPTTKDGQTIDDVLYLLIEHYSKNGMDGRMTVEQAKQAIESLIAERERLAKISQLRVIFREVWARVGSAQHPVVAYLDERLFELQAQQSGSQERV